MVAVKHGAFDFLNGCECCAPGTRRELATRRIPPSNASKHAFLLAVRHLQLPREVLRKIFEMSAVLERRVVTAPAPPAPSRRTLLEPSRDLVSAMEGLNFAAPP
jgi:hypothetical protein